MSSEMKRLKQLDEENERLKRLVADLSLSGQSDAAGRYQTRRRQAQPKL